MPSAISLQGAGIRFLVPKKGGTGPRSRLFGPSRSPLWAFRDVTLEISPGQVVGLIGPNGSGKTSLLRTMAGIYRPDEGEVVVRGRIAPILSLSAGLMGRLSGWENIALSGVLLGLSRRQVKEIASAIAEFSGLGEFLDAPVRVYSSGMRARLGFALVAFTDADVLLLDEVMSVGDQEFRERSEAKITELIRSGRTVVLASHNVEKLVEVCNSLVRLEGGRVVDVGDPAEVADRYLDRRRAMWAAAAQR